MLVGVGLAFVLTRALHVHSGYWAMITVCVVVQGNIGGTLDAGLTQFAGTVVGGVLGMAGVWLRAHHMGPDWLILFGVLAPLAVLSASDTHLRTGPVTALIVMLVTPTSGSGIALGLARIGEIAIGSVIGIAVSILVLPGRAVRSFERQIAAGLRALGPLAAAHLEAAALTVLDNSGLAQRNGSVTSHLRIGDGANRHSPRIPNGDVDLVIGADPDGGRHSGDAGQAGAWPVGRAAQPLRGAECAVFQGPGPRPALRSHAGQGAAAGGC